MALGLHVVPLRRVRADGHPVAVALDGGEHAAVHELGGDVAVEAGAQAVRALDAVERGVSVIAGEGEPAHADALGHAVDGLRGPVAARGDVRRVGYVVDADGGRRLLALVVLPEQAVRRLALGVDLHQLLQRESGLAVEAHSVRYVR